MGKKSSGGNEAAQARADEQARQDRIRTGTSQIDDTFGRQFTDDFYNGRQNAFVNYATPQLETQAADARKQLAFALARSGQTDSSVRAQKEAELQREVDLQRQGITDQGLSYANDARTKVEGSRSDLVSMLNTTGDAEGAANSAVTRASALSQPVAFSPMGQLFANFTSGLGTQAALERASALSGGAITPRYNTGLFGNSNNAVKVT